MTRDRETGQDAPASGLRGERSGPSGAGGNNERRVGKISVHVLGSGIHETGAGSTSREKYREKSSSQAGYGPHRLNSSEQLSTHLSVEEYVNKHDKTVLHSRQKPKAFVPLLRSENTRLKLASVLMSCRWMEDSRLEV
jgi:hypothetical protein